MVIVQNFEVMCGQTLNYSVQINVISYNVAKCLCKDFNLLLLNLIQIF
jgi:hypothetical protein